MLGNNSFQYKNVRKLLKYFEITVVGIRMSENYLNAWK